MLEGGLEVQARAARVEYLLRHVCGEEEFPWFISDEASLYDVCSLTPDEIISRLMSEYGVTLDQSELQLPIWKLVDRLNSLLREPKN